MRVFTESIDLNSDIKTIWGCSDLKILSVKLFRNKPYVIYLNDPDRDQEYKAEIYKFDPKELYSVAANARYLDTLCIENFQRYDAFYHFFTNQV